VEIAVVIPALDEADRIEAAIRAARDAAAFRASAVTDGEDGHHGAVAGAKGPEIVVVDGGSRDDTMMRARRLGARVLQTEPGRARQLEAGWRASAGETVLFLHADTRLEAGWSAALAAALRDPGVVGGAFRLRFDRRTWALRLVERGAAWRVRLLGLPYGDQGIFVRRGILEAMGGIPQVPLMEDLDLVVAMKARGRLAALAPAAVTSARRYTESGIFRTVGRHALALAAWRLGVDRDRVARWVGR
jgi:rSAM/selenodomain-associated transferase 2